MSFIPKNPLSLPEIEHTPSTPPGTRGLFAKEDGWYDIDSSGKTRKLGAGEGSSGQTVTYVTIRGGLDNWTAEGIKDGNGNVIGSRYGQAVNVNNAAITPNSKVDLQIDSEQMVIFYQKDLAFVTENDDGVVTVYCVGSVPENDYTIQAVVTEVVVNG